MPIKLSILNYSKKISDSTIEIYIKNLLKELSDKGANVDKIYFQVIDPQNYKLVKSFIDKSDGAKPISRDTDFECALNKYYLNDERFVIIGENIDTDYPWG